MAFRKPPLKPQVTTLWDYPSQHYGDEEQGSQDYRGATPSYVIWNVLQRFTREGDTVLDPFCGSGTTLDVCRDLGRRGLGFDLVPSREDIRQADARSLPLKSASVDLVFMDPPYADNLDYSEDPRCIGKLKADGRYQRAMRLVLDEAARVLKTDGMLAIYVCDVFKKDRGLWPLGFELFDLARNHFRPQDIVAVVRHNRTLEMGNYRKAADEGNFFLRGFNYLLLLRRRNTQVEETEARESPQGEGRAATRPRATTQDTRQRPAPAERPQDARGSKRGGPGPERFKRRGRA